MTSQTDCGILLVADYYFWLSRKEENESAKNNGNKQRGKSRSRFILPPFARG